MMVCGLNTKQTLQMMPGNWESNIFSIIKHVQDKLKAHAEEKKKMSGRKYNFLSLAAFRHQALFSLIGSILLHFPNFLSS